VECLKLAYQRQPRLAAQRGSLVAAEDGLRALDALRMPAVIARELPIRRRQAALGVTAAAAALDQAERETVYAVTRSYFTVLYARQQERVARGVVERLRATSDFAARMLQAGAREVTQDDVDRTAVYLNLAETKRLQAAEGVDRALAALVEAVGLGPDACLDVPAGELPAPDVNVCRDDAVAWALARRGDLVQASVFAEVVCLEIDAQATSIHPRMETFAAGSDIHARQVPQEYHNTEYRPGAVPPEMPTVLAGSRSERMEHVRALHARATAVVEKTRNLIALEVKDAYGRWEEAARKIPPARKAADAGDQLAERQRRGFTTGQKVKVEDVVNSAVLAAQARSQLNDFLYQQILALADLERATGGAFCAGLVEMGPAPR
jgi:outer membrane protein TolC